MHRILIGLLLITVGAVHIVAAHKNWRWYVNNYQVKAVGKAKLIPYTYLMCSPCIVFGIYMLFTDESLGS